MGFDLQTTRFVMDAKASGADFSKVVTLGRQNLFIDKEVYLREAQRFGVMGDPEAVFDGSHYVEGFLRTLGGRDPKSIDAAAYEGADFIADMNRPLPGDLTNRFSLVIDGGTLEHIFDVRQAVINIGRMLTVGGHYVAVVPANSQLGHGFWQFSPEFFYRVFSPANGFEVELVLLSEIHLDAAWYKALDPAEVRSRVQLNGGGRSYIMVRARKVADLEMFREIPQQSDYYDAAWQDPDQPAAHAHLPVGRAQFIIERYFPRPLRMFMRRLKQAVSNPFNQPHLILYRTF